MGLSLVIGGTRSGKSAHAERLAAASGLPVRYVATAPASDDDPEMAARIAAHVARRPASWQTVEAGDSLTEALAGAEEQCVLLDGLGAWIAGVLHRAGAFGAFDDGAVASVLGQVEALASARCTVVVAEQAGEGLLPLDPGSRLWLDLLGDAVRRLAGRADRVDLVVAGRVLALPEAAAGGVAPVGGAIRLKPDKTAAGEASLRHHGDTEVRPGDADHAVNVLAGGPPEWLRDALAAALDDQAERYPDERAATAALAARHDRDPDEVLPTSGAAEALWLLPAGLRPRLAACVHPAFTESEAALRAHGVPVARVLRDPASGFALDPAAVPEQADLVVVGNPASPDGTLVPAGALLALRRPGRVLVVDEACMDLVPGEPATLAGGRLPDVIVVRSLTKALAIPGLRAGYALGPPALIERLRAVRPPWSVNALALAALDAACAHPHELAAIAERVQAERADLERRLAALPGVRTWPGAANFCLIEVDDGPAALAALRAQRIAVRPAASFPGLHRGHLRLTARGPAENERLLDALAAALALAAPA
jgi:histidinol-phosphate/aromatic aminotransferase/cobyric acid decarboxylase-like protein/adenosyl cobinamide kinase/adenosyl cobinamide phosphate guanylyltransferase